jgi:hypothetical integral membrane protein (TIGR02206 family)
MRSFYQDNGAFISYSIEHILVLLFCLVFGIIFIRWAKTKTEKHQVLIGFIFSIIVMLSQLAKVFIKLELGVFDISEDLPLHLCNMMPFFIPFAIYFKNRKIWSILFFWILAGTLQAMFTPTLTENLPHYEAIRYWLVHAGLPVLVLYGTFVYGFRIKLADIFWSLFYLNIVTAIIYPINLLTGGNYLYIMHKPEPGTMFDLMGPWPWYILTCELVFIVLSLILYLPYYLYREKKV